MATMCGKTVLQVYHDEGATKKLNELGFSIQPPIEIYYDWPKLHNKFDPMSHQRETASFITMNPRCFVGNGTGSGKTASILWAFDYMKQSGIVDKMVVVCPISVIGVWENETFFSYHHLSLATIYGTSSRRKEILDTDSDIYVINFDGIKVIKDELSKWNNDRVFWVVDEASKLTNAQTETYKTFNNLLKPTNRLTLASASPTSREPTQAWALSRLINKNCPKYFGHFRDMTMTKISQFKFVPKHNANDIVFQYLQPGIVFRKEDCLDLPPITTEYLHVPLSPEQQKAYDKVRKTMAMEMESGEKINAVNAAHKLNILRQVCLGVIKVEGDDEVYKELDHTTRLNALLDLIEGEPGKILICVPFKGAIQFYQKGIEKHWSCETVNGDVSNTDRKAIFDRFHMTDTLKVLLVHDAVASHGWNAQSCSHVVLAGPIFSSENAIQLIGRVARAGQKNKMTVTKIYATRMEQQIYENIENKHDDLATLLKMYKEAVSE
jgi:SNF2 family DNA or RNA helicase